MLGKKERRRTKLMSDINITPFTDVVLVLLIIFMVTTPIITHSALKVQLPKATNVENESDQQITITVDAQGRIIVDGTQVEIKDLTEELTARISIKSNVAVVIKGDKNAKYESVVNVIDIAKLCGAKKFALAVELKNKND
jgi:biopolymer transport protein TolR